MVRIAKTGWTKASHPKAWQSFFPRPGSGLYVMVKVGDLELAEVSELASERPSESLAGLAFLGLVSFMPTGT